MNNWPDAHNNHGVDGQNQGYADGSAAWVPRSEHIETFIRGLETPPVVSPLPLDNPDACSVEVR